MEITKEALNREIERLDGKIAQELEQMKHYAEWILERIGSPESVANYGFSRSIAGIETTVREYLARREAFRDIMVEFRRSAETLFQRGSDRQMSPDPRRRRLKSPYEKWHRKLREFVGNVELDSVLAARNEFLRLENMRLLKDLGGTAIAVYPPKTPKKHEEAKKLIADQRVNYISQADYTEGARLDCIVRATLERIAAENKLRTFL